MSTLFSQSLEILTVRGRPVGYRRSVFGGELCATERGYFPVSCTGYRSLARGPLEDGMGEPPPTVAQLESLAVKNDRDLALFAGRIRKALRPDAGDRLCSHLIPEAIGRGLFARPQVRAQIWTLALELARRIRSTPRLQPHPSIGPAWTADICEEVLAAVALGETWLANALAGRIEPLSGPLERLQSLTGAYFELPEVPEPASDLAIDAAAISLELEHDDDVDDDEDLEDDGDLAGAGQLQQQLALF